MKINANLSDRHLRIFEYIRNNPGLSKEDIVRGMEGNPSRITVLNILTDLEKNQLIAARKEKMNSQIYRLYINNNVLMSSILSDLNMFKNSYFVLLDKARKIFEEQEQIIHEHPDVFPVERNQLKMADEVLSGLFSVYIFMINIYTVVGLTKWYHEVRDPEILSNLQSLVFMTIQEIQTRILDVLTPSYIFENNRISLIRFMFHYKFDIDLKYFSRLVHKFEGLELEKEFEPIMDILWKNSYDLIDFSMYIGMKRKGKFKEWRDAVKHYQRVYGYL